MFSLGTASCAAMICEIIEIAAERLVMKTLKTISLGLAVLFVLSLTTGSALAQNSPVVLSGAELTKVVPTSFYFKGQSAPTQMRNTAAARFGPDRYVIG